MKTKSKILFGLLTTIGLALSSAMTMAAPATSKAALNVRTGPGTSFNVIDTLLPGERVEVTECVSNGWCRIEHPGPDGWVSSRYLKPVTSGSSGGSGSSDPDCSFGITVGPGGPAFSFSCGDAPPPVAPPPPAPPPVDSKACFYKGNNHSGSKVCNDVGIYKPVLNASWNNSISSLTLSGSAKVKVCQGANMSGLCSTYNNNVSVLNGNLNNKISSYLVFSGALPLPPAPPPPPAPPASPVTFSTGPLNIPQTGTADLDTGNIGVGGSDIWYQAVTAIQKFITPRNGAKLSISGPANRGFSGCSTASYTANKISVWTLPVGSYVCVKTDEGRISEFRLNGYTGTTMNLGYTTWTY